MGTKPPQKPPDGPKPEPPPPPPRVHAEKIARRTENTTSTKRKMESEPPVPRVQVVRRHSGGYHIDAINEQGIQLFGSNCGLPISGTVKKAMLTAAKYGWPLFVEER